MKTTVKLFLSCGMFAVACQPSEEPSENKNRSYKIVYVNSPHGNQHEEENEEGEKKSNMEIFIMDADGENEKNLTNNPAVDTEPSWAPDGKHIVFASNRDGSDELYTLEIATGNITRLTNNDSMVVDCQPSWSPDGKHIAFVSTRREGNWDIYVMDADGNNVKQITKSDNMEASPAWSPDGAKIAYVENDTSQEGKMGKRWHVYTADAFSGENQVQITFFEGINWSPVWYPDGKNIMYMSTRNNNEDLFSLNLETGEEKQLTTDEGSEDMATLSPDGKYVAFMYAKELEKGKEIHAVFSMNLETGERKQVSKGDGFNPRWSPVPVGNL